MPTTENPNRRPGRVAAIAEAGPITENSYEFGRATIGIFSSRHLIVLPSLLAWNCVSAQRRRQFLPLKFELCRVHPRVRSDARIHEVPPIHHNPTRDRSSAPV